MGTVWQFAAGEGNHRCWTGAKQDVDFRKRAFHAITSIDGGRSGHPFP
jgi:hypothetical protein